MVSHIHYLPPQEVAQWYPVFHYYQFIGLFQNITLIKFCDISSFFIFFLSVNISLESALHCHTQLYFINSPYCADSFGINKPQYIHSSVGELEGHEKKKTKKKKRMRCTERKTAKRRKWGERDKESWEVSELKKKRKGVI